MTSLFTSLIFSCFIIAYILRVTLFYNNLKPNGECKMKIEICEEIKEVLNSISILIIVITLIICLFHIISNKQQILSQDRQYQNIEILAMIKQGYSPTEIRCVYDMTDDCLINEQLKWRSELTQEENK